MHLLFPSYHWHKYAQNHFSFLHQYARLAGINVEIVQDDDRIYTFPDKWIISCVYEHHQIIFDYADHNTALWNDKPNVPYFKFHYSPALHDKLPNVFPIGPSLVADKRMETPMDQYFDIRKQFVYEPTRKVVNKQRPYAGALQRRTNVRNMLASTMRGDVDLELELSHSAYWWKCREACAVVCVPGATNNMLDRGQYELIGLGVCTVSPRLEVRLPNDEDLIPGVHYVACKDDYSDLVEILRRLQNDLETSKRIGANARKLFEDVSMPEKYWQWIRWCMKYGKENMLRDRL